MARPARTDASDRADTASALADLCARAAPRAAMPHAYRGEALPQEAWDYLHRDAQAVLVDVRTPAEWEQGIPDMSEAGGRLVTISWKLAPDYTVNPRFADDLKTQGIRQDTPLFFMCRGGGRSLDAAVAMTALGYGACFNITGGFEGRHHPTQPDEPGWKDSGLPWRRP